MLQEFWDRIDKLTLVLVGGFGIDLSLNFMYSKTETDFLILKNIKVCVHVTVCIVVLCPISAP